MSAVERILIVGPTWVGDMMMSHTLYQLLKQQKPDCHIDVLAPAWSEALLERMPEVDGRLVSPFKRGQWGFRERLAFGRRLRDRGYTQAIVLPNSWKSALAPYMAKIPKRTGWAGEQRYYLLNDIRRLDKKRYALMIERFMALALPKGAPLAITVITPKIIGDRCHAGCLPQSLIAQKTRRSFDRVVSGFRIRFKQALAPAIFCQIGRGAIGSRAHGLVVWLAK